MTTTGSANSETPASTRMTPGCSSVSAIRTEIEAVHHQGHSVFGKPILWYIEAASLGGTEAEIFVRGELRILFGIPELYDMRGTPIAFGETAFGREGEIKGAFIAHQNLWLDSADGGERCKFLKRGSDAAPRLGGYAESLRRIGTERLGRVVRFHR
jgi:hypothetical protein